MNKTKSLLMIIGSVVILGAALVSSLRSKEEVIERPERSPTAETVYHQREQVDLFSEDGAKIKEDLDIRLNVDDKRSTISLELLTQNFDNKKWGAEAMQFNRFTRINGRWSEIYLLHLAETKVYCRKQVGYAVPKHEWILLIPAEEDETCEIIRKEGEKLIKEVINISIPLPGADEALGSFLKKKREEKNAVQKTLEGLEKKGYKVTRIPGKVQRSLTNLTARIYEIKIDAGKIKEGTPFQTYLWARTAVGDPSVAPDGMAQNRYGIHDKMISFTLTGKKRKEQPKPAPKRRDPKPTPEKRTVREADSRNIEVYTKFVKKDKNYEIFVKIDGKEKRLTNTQGHEEGVVLSPNKRIIAFNEKKGRKTRDPYMKCLMNIDGTNKRELYPLNWMKGHDKVKWAEDSRGFIMRQRCTAASEYGQVTYYKHYFFDIEQGRATKVVGGEKWDYDAQQAVPFDETREQRIERRRRLLEDVKARGKKIPIPWGARDFLE